MEKFVILCLGQQTPVVERKAFTTKQKNSVNFKTSSDSELLTNDIIVRRRGEKVVGLTVLDASHFRS